MPVVTRDPAFGAFAEPAPRPRQFGSLKGRIHIADGFDHPLPDFEPYT